MRFKKRCLLYIDEKFRVYLLTKMLLIKNYLKCLDTLKRR